MTKQEIIDKINKLENGIKSKATPSNLITPLKAQKRKFEELLKEREEAEKKAVKTKKVSKVAEKIKAAKTSVAKKTPAKAPAKEERKKDNIARDGDRKSLPSGKRISKSGKVYYETRANRSDKQTSKKPYLAKGGETDPMASVNEISRLTGLRPIAVAEWGDKNNINLSVVLKDLKSKKIKGMDLMTAVVGKPNNKYQKELLAKYSKSKMADGGETEEGVDLFEDYENIPTDVQKILDKHSDAFEDGDYRKLEKANNELKKIGYTFEYGLDGEAYDLRKIGQKGKMGEDEYAKGGNLKVYDSQNSYRLSRPSGSIEKELLNKVSFSEDDFVGNFGWKTSAGKLADGYLYNLDESDQKLVKDIKLKEGEKIYRYFNRTTAIGGIKPLIKINLDKGLLYFPILQDNEDIVFETKGIQAMWVSLIGEKMAKGGTLNNPKFLEYYQVLDRWAHYRLTIEKGKEYYLPTESTIEKILANDIMFNDGKVDKSTHDKINNLLVQQLKDLKMNAYPEYADGGKIKNQYEGKTAKEVWDNLSKEQRQHFLYDHKQGIEDYRGEEYGELKSKEIIAAYNSDWDKLDKNIKNRFDNHVREGQYAKGGELKKAQLLIIDPSNPLSTQLKKLTGDFLNSADFKDIGSGNFNILTHKHSNKVFIVYPKRIYDSLPEQEKQDDINYLKNVEKIKLDTRSMADGGELNELKNKDMNYAKGGNTDALKKIKDYYVGAFPTDDLGQEINADATFNGLSMVLNDKGDVYEYLGVADSLVRERVFEKLSKIEGVSYDVIYDKWLDYDYAKGGYMADGGEITKENLKIGDRIESKEADYGVYVVKSLYNKDPHIWEIRNDRGDRTLGEGELKFWKFSNKMADGGEIEKYVVEKDKDGSYKILNTERGMYIDQTFETKSSAESWKKEKDLQRERFGMESYFAKGGQVPAHFGSGKNIEVFGYETKNFDICGTAVKEFEAAVDIMKDSKELEKESLAYCAKYVDNLFGIEKVVVEGGIGGELNFSHAVSDIMSASTYNFRAGMAINLYSFVPQHLMEIALRLAKAEKGGFYALGGMTAGRWYKDKSGEEFKFIGKVDSGANKGRFLFSDGQKSVYKDLEDFEGGKPKETKLFGFFEDGGSVAEGNYEMLMSNIKAIKHHAEELADAVKPDTEIEAWVLSKSERAETDLSDITHYLDGLKMEKGGYMAEGGFFDTKGDVKFKFSENEKIKVLQYDGGKLKKLGATIIGQYAAEQPDGTYYPFYWVVGDWNNAGKQLYAEDELIERHGNKPKKMAKGGDLNSIKEEYLKNEDENAHSENVVLLAKHFGTKEDLAKAKEILALHEKEGSLSSENGKKRQELNLKLIGKARAEMSKQGIEFEKGGYMAKGGEVRYKLAGNNFGQQIESGKKFAELIKKAHENQTSEHKYPENFIKEIAYTGKIVKNDGTYFLKDYSYKGVLDRFEFLGDKYFLESLKYLNRPTIKNFKFEDGGMMAKGGIYSSDSLYILKVSKDGKEVGEERFRAKNTREAREMGEDYEEKYKSKFGGDLSFSVKEAESKMAKGGETKYTKKWRVFGITMQGKRFDKEITLGRMSDKNDVMNALKRMYDTQIREVTSIQEVMARGGFVSKGELVWRKLTNAKKMEFLKENFTPEITPRSQETLVGKDYNFLPKKVKIKFEAKYANVEDYASGGKVKFADKVKAVQESLLKRKKVAPQVQKDYGKTYSKAEAKESAQRIVGSRMAQLKEKMAKKKK